MHSGISHENSVRPSVECVNCDKTKLTKETSAEVLILYERPIHCFLIGKMVGGDDPLYLKVWVKLNLLLQSSINIRS